MDDFEYSLHISDQDWDTFFQECEGCNLLSPGLASREDSGMSDMDEKGSHFLDVTRLSDAASAEPDLQIDGPPDCEGSPVDNYLSKYGIRSPEQVLSGSEEDLHLQTVNLFFEQLKSVTVNEQPLEQSRVESFGSEKTGHLESLIDKQDIQYVVICPSGRNVASPKREISKQGEADTWGSTALENAIMPTCTNAQVNASDSSEKEPVIGGESLSSQQITVGVKQEQEKRRCDLSAHLKLKPETKPPDKEKMPPMVTVNGIDMTHPKENIAQLEIGSSSDSKDSPVGQIPVSPSNLRRKRRKKKRMNMEAGETSSGYDQIRVHQSESERFVQKEEMNNLPANVRKTEETGIKISSILHNSENLQQNFTAGSAGLKLSKSLPVSFATFGLDAKPQVRQTSMCSISKSMNEMSLVTNGQIKAESGPKSIIAKTDKILIVQESEFGLNTTESDSAIQLRDTDCSPTLSRTNTREPLSEPVSDNSPAGCQRKSLLSPNISSAADSTQPLSSSVSFNLTVDPHKDVSCLGNETDCCAFKSEHDSPSRWSATRISDAQQNSLDEESCSDENAPKMLSRDTSQNACVDILESQTFKTNIDIPLSETNLEIECCVMESTFGKDIQNINNYSKELMANGSLIKLDNSTKKPEYKQDKSIHEDGNLSKAVEDMNNGEDLLNHSATRSSEHICGHKEEILILNEDSTQNALSNVSEVPHPRAAESQGAFSLPPESGGVSKDPEITGLDTSDQIPSPVFAISSFWNEMEKLTINDILRLRMIGSAQPPSVLTQPDERSVADTTDAADSGYFTQPDDSKPERLSGDMSFISDLDEDLAQLQTQYSLKQDDESCGFPSRSCSVLSENDSDPAIVGEDVVYISSESALPEHLYAADAQQCFRKMCKNISVQNLQALDAQPIRQMLRNASLHSIHSEAEDPFYHVNTSYPTCFSDDEDMESGGITFSEIIQFFFGDDEPERCASRADNASASYLEESGTSVPEMYDHFFSEFDSGSFLNPFEDESGGKDQIVPIFSCTRSANRNLQFPEAYDYFFPDSPGHSDEDDENDNSPIRVVSRYDHKSSNHYSVASTDMYEHFYPEDTFQSDLLWANPFSLRSVRRTDPAVPEDSSWALTPVKQRLHKGIQSITVIGPDDKPFPDSLYFNLENRIFQQLAEQQKKCIEMQTVIADPRLDAPFLPLKQADMCLVCIAFASWVLKSASPGADTWKAALLANISALSAIRYLRRHKREEVSGKTPLRQIEPA